MLIWCNHFFKENTAITWAETSVLLGINHCQIVSYILYIADCNWYRGSQKNSGIGKNCYWQNFAI